MNKIRFLKILMDEGLLRHNAESIWNGRPPDIKKKDLTEYKLRKIIKKIIAENWLLKLQREQKKSINRKAGS